MAPADRTIRVLYVDDSRLDRALVRDALSDQPNLTLTETASREDFLERLGEQSYDIVLSDFNILGFMGLDVISLVQENAKDTPVVIVTGTGNEEVAVEAMKRGAADYVIKSPAHIRRLPVTIASAVEQQSVRRERERLQAELDRFFSQCREMLCLLDREGRFRRINPAFEAALSYPLDDLIGRSFVELVDPEDQVAAQEACRRIVGGDAVTHVTCRCVGSDQSVRWMEWVISASVERDVLYATVRDVTDRRRDEDEARRRLLVMDRVSQLSERERSVLSLVVQGLPNKGIAQRLDLSEKTVEKYRSRGMKKLKVSTMADLVRLAVEEQIL